MSDRLVAFARNAGNYNIGNPKAMKILFTAKNAKKKNDENLSQKSVVRVFPFLSQKHALRRAAFFAQVAGHSASGASTTNSPNNRAPGGPPAARPENRAAAVRNGSPS
jgi:hypothetical protein